MSRSSIFGALLQNLKDLSMQSRYSNARLRKAPSQASLGQFKMLAKGSEEPENFGQYIAKMRMDSLQAPNQLHLRVTPPACILAGGSKNGSLDAHSKSKQHKGVSSSSMAGSPLKQQPDANTFPEASSVDAAETKSDAAYFFESLDGSPLKRSSLPVKKPYRLAHQNEGAFAFKSTRAMKQPDYPLKFVEKNLKFRLEYEEMQQREKKMTKQGSMLRLAMRAKIVMMALEMRQATQRKIGESHEQQMQRLKSQQSISSYSELGKLMKQFEVRKHTKTVAQKYEYESFQPGEIHYYDDHKFPFQLVKDVPIIIKRLCFNSINWVGVGEQKGVKQSENELLRFYKNNKSSMANMVVYLFWILISILFDDYNICSFPKEFIDEVRQALQEQYKQVYFNYLLRLKQNYMDAIIEVLPFFLAVTVKHSLAVKLKNHELPLSHDKMFVLLCSVVFRELFGYEASEMYIRQGKKRFIRRVDERRSFRSSSLSVQTNASKYEKRHSKSAFAKDSSMRGAQPNTSIYQAPVYSTQRDSADGDPKKDYKEAIKQDLVNELVGIYSKGKSGEAKQAISSQIIAMDDRVEKPAQILEPEIKSKVFYVQNEHNFVHANTQQPRRSAMPRRVTMQRQKQPQLGRIFSHDAQITQEKLKCQLPAFRHKLAGAPLGSTLTEVMKLGEIHEQIRKSSPKKQRAESLVDLRSSIQNATVPKTATAQTQSILRCHSAKAMPEKKPQDPSKQTVQILQKIIRKLRPERESVASETPELAKVERRVQSALGERKEKGETDHLYLSGRKFKTDDCKQFDLHYLTPIVRQNFSKQLVQSHYPDRKQKVLLVQNEQACEKVSSYEQKIKNYLTEKEAEVASKAKVEESERLQAQEKAQKALSKEKTQHHKQYHYAREAVSIKLMRASEQKAEKQARLNLQPKEKVELERAEQRRELNQKALERQATHKTSFLCRTGTNAQKRASMLSGAAQLDLQTSDVDMKTEGQQSRNVKFQSIVHAFSPSLSQRSTTVLHPRDKKSAVSTKSEKDAAKFFHDKDYEFVQRTWELPKQQPMKQGKKRVRSSKKYLTSAMKAFGELKFMPNLRKLTDDLAVQGATDLLAKPAPFSKIRVEDGMSNSDVRKMERDSSIKKCARQSSITTMTKSQSQIGPLISLNSLMKKDTMSRQPSRAFLMSASQLSRAERRLETAESLILDAPYTERDLAMQMTRKTSKILREGKTVHSNQKELPMLAQFINFVKQYPDKNENEERKQLEEEIVRRRIDDALPTDLKKTSNWVKKRPPQGQMADMHTYSTLRKITSHKTRKKFIFDSYTAKQKLQQQAKSAKDSQTEQQLTEQAAEESKQEQASSSARQQYNVYRASNFENVEKSKERTVKKVDTDVQRRQYLKPPKPIVKKQASGASMLHIISQSSQRDAVNSYRTLQQFDSKAGKTFSSESEGLLDDDSSYPKTPKERNEFIHFMRSVKLANDLDDKADVRDGIADSKGKLRNINDEYRAFLKLVPHEQNTKVYKMLKQLRTYMHRQRELRREIKEKNAKEVVIVDSDDEKERHEEGQDVIVARPNPLEPAPKKRKKVTLKKPASSKPEPSSKAVIKPLHKTRLEVKFREQKQKARTQVPELKLFDTGRSNKQQHYD